MDAEISAACFSEITVDFVLRIRATREIRPALTPSPRVRIHGALRKVAIMRTYFLVILAVLCSPRVGLGIENLASRAVISASGRRDAGYDSKFVADGEIPGAGSKETIDFVAERRYSYMGIP